MYLLLLAFALPSRKAWRSFPRSSPTSSVLYVSRLTEQIAHAMLDGDDDDDHYDDAGPQDDEPSIRLDSVSSHHQQDLVLTITSSIF